MFHVLYVVLLIVVSTQVHGSQSKRTSSQQFKGNSTDVGCVQASNETLCRLYKEKTQAALLGSTVVQGDQPKAQAALLGSTVVQGDQPNFEYCFCNKFATKGMQCNPNQGKQSCNCLPNYQGRRCERCMPGYYSFPNCLPCKCNSEGSTNLVCDKYTGRCPCKIRIRGMKCDLCPLSHYDFPRCTACSCSAAGSYSFLCQAKTGQCPCKPAVYGRQCNRCPAGYYNFPLCWWCGCNLKTTTQEVCDTTGKCKCKQNFQGAACDECKPGYYSYPLCTVCDCKSGFGKCGKSGECICYKGYTGRSCDKCSVGYYGFPHCRECACNKDGSHSLTCDRVTGKCQCKINVVGDKCGECVKGLVGFPACKQCTCSPIGTKPRPGGGTTCFGVRDMRCLCKANVEGKTCDRCRYGFYDFSDQNPTTCTSCACSNRGSLPGIRGCNFTTGACSCKSYVTGNKCDTCKNGTYGMMSRDLFGCKECSCNPGGSFNSICNKNTGHCQCRPNVQGPSCDRIAPASKTYFPTLYHIRAELEDAVGDDGIPVLAGSEQSAFPSFSSAGYVIPPVHMPFSVDIDVPVSSTYRVLIHYALALNDAVSTDVTFFLKGARSYTHRVVQVFRPTSFSGKTRGKLIALEDNGKTKQLTLSKGTWKISFSCRSALLLMDYVTLLPEEYYTGSVLKHTPVEPCKANVDYNHYCSTFKYFSTKDSHIIYGIHGFIDSGLPVIKYNEPKLSVKRLRFGNSIALLGKYQAKVNYEVQVSQAGSYVLVIKYLHSGNRIHRVSVSHDKDHGMFEALPCNYRYACKQVVNNVHGGPMMFKLKGELFRNKVSLTAPSKANIGIISITVSEESKWNTSYVIPFFYCHFYNHKCVKTLYSTPKGSVKLSKHRHQQLHQLPDGKVRLVMNGPVEHGGIYHVVIHYKQTSYLQSKGKVSMVPRGIPVTMDVTLPYCPAIDGCRTKVSSGGLDTLSFSRGVASARLDVSREVVIVYALLVPENALTLEVLKPHPGHKIQSFLKTCSKNNFYINPEKQGNFLCRDSIFAMTLSLVGNPMRCECDPKGSRSLVCNAFGGQCRCKPNVVGRKCDRCPIRYTGFPQCRKCSCSTIGSTSQECEINGVCRCLPGYGGRKCDRCKSYGYYGYPQCKKCSCNDRGSLSMFCNQRTGQCQCRRNYGGLKCDQCRVGYFDYPACKACNCNPAGMQVLPGQENTCGNVNDQSCSCKRNVQGARCNECKDLHYGLNIYNPVGCQSCGCNTKGTLGSISSCDKANGDCLCKHHVTGRECSRCKSGYYNLLDWNLFGCTKCACNVGGSFGSYCDVRTGQCICLPGLEGRRCERVIPYRFYYADLHHIKIELEDATNERNHPVVVRDRESLFPGFTWKGYTELNTYQPRIFMVTTVPRTTRYRLIFHYSLNQHKPLSALLRFQPTSESGYLPSGPAKPFQVGVLFKPTASWKSSAPQFLTVLDSQDLPVEVLLSQGKWKLSLAASPSYVFLDHLVLLPEDYYNPTSLRNPVNNQCQVGSNAKYCQQFRYPSMEGDGFVTVEAEKSLLTGPKTDIVQPPFKGVTLQGNQNVLTVDLPRDQPTGSYVIVTTFYYEDLPRTGRLKVLWQSGRSTQQGWFNIFTCRFTSSCRQVAIDTVKHVQFFKVLRNAATVLTLSTSLTVAVDSITVISQDKWEGGYLLPGPQCVKTGPSCVASTFTTPSNAMTIQAENNTDTIKNGNANRKPSYVQDHTIRLAYLATGQRTIYLNTRASRGRYFIIVHFFQPQHISFSGKVVVSYSGSAVASRVNFRHCPHVSGCRSAGTSKTRLEAKERVYVNFETDLLVTVTIPDDKSVWIDYILLVPTRSFTPSILEADQFDLSSEFKQQCARNHFFMKSSAPPFCLQSVFTLSSRFNRGGIPCECNTSGSLNEWCQSYGGQCKCKSNVIGRTCNTCKAGFTGFPNCRRR